MIAKLEEHKAPIIGISGIDSESGSLRAAMSQIQAAGGIPLFLGNHANRDAAEDIQKLDGLLVLGNKSDIDPERYGAARDPHTKAESDTPEGKARADYEYALMKLALEKKVPLMGICGGMQRLNVMCGGSLHQHVPDLTGNNFHAQQDMHIAPFIPVQTVVIQRGSALSGIAGDIPALFTPAHGVGSLSIIHENSMHHQSVKDIGRGLRSNAMSTDGIIEGIEADPNGPFKDQYVMGIQWHPEFGVNPLGPKLAENLVSEAVKHAEKNQHTQPTMSDIIQENIKSSLPVMTASTRLQQLSTAMTR
jgi:putative glutamine amidotransferase